MNKQQLTKQIELLHKELSSADKRCKRISAACGIESNELISYAVEQTRQVLEYIESLKEDACPECGLSGQHKMSCDTQYE